MYKIGKILKDKVPSSLFVGIVFVLGACKWNKDIGFQRFSPNSAVISN